jgi:hypothetical protein
MSIAIQGGAYFIEVIRFLRSGRMSQKSHCCPNSRVNHVHFPQLMPSEPQFEAEIGQFEPANLSERLIGTCCARKSIQGNAVAGRHRTAVDCVEHLERNPEQTVML